MIYLLYGEERYLLETKLKKIKKGFGETVKGINYIQIDAETVLELIADIETPAFGYPTKLIIARNTGLFKKERKTAKSKSAKEDVSEKKKKANTATTLTDKIAEYVKNHKEVFEKEVTLVFVEEEADKNELYKAIEKIGEITNFELLKMPQLIDNIRKLCSAYKVNIDFETAKYFIECCRNKHARFN